MDLVVNDDGTNGAEYYVDEPPERDIGPETSREVILRDLRQMANDYSKNNMGSEMNKMKKLETIYMITGSQGVASTAKNLDNYKATLKEKRMMLDELKVANAKLRSMNGKKGPLAITNGSTDKDVSNVQDLNVKLLEMENRIQEARRAIESKEKDAGLAEALRNYHEVFKKTMDCMEDASRGKPTQAISKIKTFSQFIADTERTIVSDDTQDPDVKKALNELRLLNKYDTLSPNKLPFIPELPYNLEEDLANLDMMSNEILEDVGVPDDKVEIPLAEFLKHVPSLKPAKSIARKIESTDQKRKTKSKAKKEFCKV